MAKDMKKRLKKVGLLPGSLVYTGERPAGPVTVTVLDYDEKSFREQTLANGEQCFPFRDAATVTWINVDGIHDGEIIRKLGECYGLHPLVLEDIMNTGQRPKMEDYGDYLYVVLAMLTNHQHKDGVVAEQVSLILGKNFVISFQEGIEGDVFNQIRDRIKNDKGRIRKMGADYLAYSLLDAIVDQYFVILERLGERIEDSEERLVAKPSRETLGMIHALKREMILLRRSVWPLRELIAGLERGESSLVQKGTRVYLRDVYDHTIQVIDTVETFRDVVSGMLDIYLSSMSNRMNEIMKVLTIIATIFMPLTFLAGVYGMNFKFMPELDKPWGYPAVLSLMLLVAGVMIVYFRRKKWM